MSEPSQPLRDIISQIPPLDATNAEDALQHDAGRATEEAKAYAGKTLDEESEENEHHRQEGLRDTVHKLVGWAAYGFFGLYAVAVVCVFWHYLVSEKYAWMSSNQLHAVTAAVFSGAITSKGGQYFSRRIR